MKPSAIIRHTTEWGQSAGLSFVRRLLLKASICRERSWVLDMLTVERVLFCLGALLLDSSVYWGILEFWIEILFGIGEDSMALVYILCLHYVLCLLDTGCIGICIEHRRIALGIWHSVL